MLARDAWEQLALDRLLFIPAAVSPHRVNEPPRATPAQRVAMLRCALDGERGFEVDECELRRPSPSYTFDTVQEMLARHPGARLYLLLGADQLPTFGAWHRFEELRSLVTFVVFHRAAGAEEHLAAAYPTLRRRLDLSATEVRQRVASGRTVRYLVPEAVAAYIHSQHLYLPEAPTS